MKEDIKVCEAVPFLKAADADALLEAFLITAITSSKLSSPTMIPLYQKERV